jgi:hypothetical protein
MPKSDKSQVSGRRGDERGRRAVKPGRKESRSCPRRYGGDAKISRFSPRFGVLSRDRTLSVTGAVHWAAAAALPWRGLAKSPFSRRANAWTSPPGQSKVCALDDVACPRQRESPLQGNQRSGPCYASAEPLKAASAQDHSPPVLSFILKRRTTTVARVAGFRLTVRPTVFHPRYFLTSEFFANFL